MGQEGERSDIVRRLGAREIIFPRAESVGKRLSSMGGADLILLTAASARLFEQCVPGLGVNGTRDDMAAMLRFAAGHGIAPVVERYPLGSVNEVVEKLRAGKVLFRAVLVS